MHNHNSAFPKAMNDTAQILNRCLQDGKELFYRLVPVQENVHFE